MVKKTVKLVEGVYVHIKEFGGGSYFQHVKVQSERHAERLCGKLGWHETSRGAGQWFRHTWYNSNKKQLVSNCGYDI